MLQQQTEEMGQVLPEGPFEALRLRRTALPCLPDQRRRLDLPGLLLPELHIFQCRILHQGCQILGPVYAAAFSAQYGRIHHNELQLAHDAGLLPVGMQHTRIDEYALALLQQNLLSVHQEFRLTLGHPGQLEFLMPVPGHRRLTQILLIAGCRKSSGAVLLQLKPAGICRKFRR